MRARYTSLGISFAATSSALRMHLYRPIQIRACDTVHDTAGGLRRLRPAKTSHEVIVQILFVSGDKCHLERRCSRH